MTKPMKRAKRTRRIVGDVLKIVPGGGTHTYARVFPDASYVFYDSRGTDESAVGQVTGMPILFIIAVMDYAVKEGRWPVIGHVPFDGEPILPPQFIQDPLNQTVINIYANGFIRSATKQECVGLERAVVWDPANVEDRLRDHDAGRKNEMLEIQKISDGG